jgi:hypothetical protein
MQQTKKQIIKRGLIYSLMSASVVVIVSLLMLVVLGYSFNPKDNRLEQGGLLQFASVPSGATVTLDEVPLGSRTPSKTTADARSHTVTMSLEGYRTWHKTINLKAGMIGWLSYARLVPSDPKVEKLRTLPTLASALASPDDKWMAMIENTAAPTIMIADLQNDKLTYKSLVIAADHITQPAAGKTQSFSLAEWSKDGRYILVRHMYDDTKTEWIVVDREDPLKTKNISARLGLTTEKLIFERNDGRTALALTDGAVRRLNLSDETLSRPLVTNVEEFSTYNENTVLYTTKPDPITKQRSVGYLIDNMDVSQQLATFPDDGQPVHLAMDTYFGKRYVVTSHGAVVDVMSGDLPRQESKGTLKTVKSFTTVAPVRYLSLSSNGRFVIAQTDTGYTVHDLELGKTDTTLLKDLTGVARPLKWIDAFITWYDAGGTLRLYEFDGANQQNIVPVAEGYDVTLSQNQKYLYSIGKDGTGFTLQRVRMVLD